VGFFVCCLFCFFAEEHFGYAGSFIAPCEF
jgi:hypothetical protein